jgi:hypothetical protein
MQNLFYYSNERNMYYSFPCTYCGRLFYTYNGNKESAATTLYNGVKQHLKEYDEDRKEYEMDDGPTLDIEQIYHEASSANDRPSGGYEL